MSNYHGCQEEAISLIPHYLIDIIHKTVKPSHLEKLQIIQNINKLMFQVIFIFSDWSFLQPFCLGGNIFSKNSSWSFDWGTRARMKMHRFNTFSRNVNTINWKLFPTHSGKYKSENSTSILERDKTLWSLKKYEKMHPWG